MNWKTKEWQNLDCNLLGLHSLVARVYHTISANYLMNIRRFVGASSVILVAWLSATFFNSVPSAPYPKLDKSAATRAGLEAIALAER